MSKLLVFIALHTANTEYSRHCCSKLSIYIRKVVYKSSSPESRIGSRFDRMDRKACTKNKGPTTQYQLGSRAAIHHCVKITRTQRERRHNGGPSWARGRPAGLQLSAFGPHNKYRPKEAIRDVCAKAVARWPHPQAGLGEAGRPHLAASRAPASRGRQAHRPYLLTTDATGINCQESTLEGYK